MMDQAAAFFLAVLAALIYAVGGYLKQAPPEKFNEEKIFVTAIIGIVIGVVSFFVGSSYGSVEQLLISAGAIVYIEVWAKAIYRKMKDWLESRSIAIN